MKGTRRITKIQLCERHAPWFAGCTRNRTIECMVEGGPGGWTPGCENGQCRIWPGTDTFEASICTTRAGFLSESLNLDWTHAA
jgi:hypothetical protein